MFRLFGAEAPGYIDRENNVNVSSFCDCHHGFEISDNKLKEIQLTFIFCLLHIHSMLIVKIHRVVKYHSLVVVMEPHSVFYL